MMARVLGIARFRMASDGPGISTLVGLRQCKLHCKYCINPQCNGSFHATFTAEELYQVVSLDAIYFHMTGGGVTFGGGEPAWSSEYIHEFAAQVHHQWPIRIETSLNVPAKHIRNIISDIDTWYIDIKDMNPRIYKAYTGENNDDVKTNLAYLVRHVNPDKIIVRVPRIPDYNTTADVARSVEILRAMHVRHINLFNYIKSPHTCGK
jgi:pyruvate formate lyase activating enzyme